MDMETHPQPTGLVSFLDEQFSKVYTKQVSLVAEGKLARSKYQGCFRNASNKFSCSVSIVCLTSLCLSHIYIYIYSFYMNVFVRVANSSSH